MRDLLQVKLFADFYQSDVIVGSPLALVTHLDDASSGGADCLSSIEVCLVLRADVMLMQNWSHVDTLLKALNRVPTEQHGTDIMRVRCVPTARSVWRAAQRRCHVVP